MHFCASFVINYVLTRHFFFFAEMSQNKIQGIRGTKNGILHLEDKLEAYLSPLGFTLVDV